MTIHLIVSLRVSFLLTGPYCSSTGLLVSSEKHTWLIKMKYIVEIVQIIPRDIHIRRGTNRFFQHSFFPIRVDIYNNNDRWYVSISSLLSRVHVVPIVLYIYARSRPLETTVGEKAGETRVEDVILGGVWEGGKWDEEDSRNDGCRAERTCYPLRRKSRRSNYFSRMARSLKDRERRGGGSRRDDVFRAEIWHSTRGPNKRRGRKKETAAFRLR